MGNPLFKVLFEQGLESQPPPQWESWNQCALGIHQKFPITTYSVVKAENSGPFLVFVPKQTGPIATNCHTYTDRLLKNPPPFLKTNAVLGIPVCGSNPQQIILDNTTTTIAERLPQEPLALLKELDKLSLRPGDILVWVDPHTGNLVHSTTMIGRVDGVWMANDKMNDQPARRISLPVIASELYRPPAALAGEEEFHPERMPSGYYVMVRRPR